MTNLMLEQISTFSKRIQLFKNIHNNVTEDGILCYPDFGTESKETLESYLTVTLEGRSIVPDMLVS